MLDPLPSYASSPTVSHEFEPWQDVELRILYLRIEVNQDGFHWEVRLHDAPDPIACATRRYQSNSDARKDGQGALNKACAQFKAFRGFK